MANTRNVGRSLARGSLHRLVRPLVCHVEQSCRTGLLSASEIGGYLSAREEESSLAKKRERECTGYACNDEGRERYDKYQEEAANAKTLLELREHDPHGCEPGDAAQRATQQCTGEPN